jgi:glutamate-ammonia-ligase adenylyltransferase
VRADAAAMRARVARDLPLAGPWDVKLRPGGLIDVEFVAQALQLVHARDHPESLSPTTRIALQRMADAGLLDPADAELLIRADHLWRTVQGMLRITLGRAAGEELAEASAKALTRAAGAVDVAELRATMDRVAREVRAAFERLVGRPEPALLEEMKSP